jgi:hypothetical protein
MCVLKMAAKRGPKHVCEKCTIKSSTKKYFVAYGGYSNFSLPFVPLARYTGCGKLT